jgi:two-component system sensor histidine kinase KdpD
MFAIVNATTVGFAYLIVILLVAAQWGLAESVFASVIATICFNYFFLPPVGTWTIADPENWVALFAFLMSALIASELSNRARRRTAEANARKAEMERLYALSRALLVMDGSRPVGEQVARELAVIADIPAVAVYDLSRDAVYRGGGEELPDIETRLREVAQNGSPPVYESPPNAIRHGLREKENQATILAPISLGGANSGSIAIRGAGLSTTALRALLNLIAITLENARSREIVTRAQAAQQSEEFKSTLLDGLAHEFKTPLTSIKAATTALLASNVSDPVQQRELLTIVDQETDRLSRLVTEATRVARIEAGKIHVNRRRQSVNSVIETVLRQMEAQCDGRSLEVCLSPDLPEVLIDPDLIHLALRQLIDNALKYSPRRSLIRISSEAANGDVIIAVHNQGEPLSETERSRIFDKFYRGRNVRHQVAGTGMGLPVAREILMAHGGDVQLRSSDERGIEFVMKIPQEAKQPQGPQNGRSEC